MVEYESMAAVGKEKVKRPTSGVVDARIKALRCAEEADRFKALDLMMLEVSGVSSFTDYFVICSGKSSRQVQGIADNLETALRRYGHKPLGIEGQSEGQWILMDYGDVIVHIFYEPVRLFYDLESLWADAKRVAWDRESTAQSLDTIEGGV